VIGAGGVVLVGLGEEAVGVVVGSEVEEDGAEVVGGVFRGCTMHLRRAVFFGEVKRVWNQNFLLPSSMWFVVTRLARMRPIRHEPTLAEAFSERLAVDSCQQ